MSAVAPDVLISALGLASLVLLLVGPALATRYVGHGHITPASIRWSRVGGVLGALGLCVAGGVLIRLGQQGALPSRMWAGWAIALAIYLCIRIVTSRLTSGQQSRRGPADVDARESDRE